MSRPPENAERRTVLLVDDDDAVRTMIARYLVLNGFAVTQACNGLDALAALRSGGTIGAIVLDLRMPVMDGWAFRRAQRDDLALISIPVIVLSGADADRFSELDADAVFEKPVTLSSLAAALRRFVKSS